MSTDGVSTLVSVVDSSRVGAGALTIVTEGGIPGIGLEEALVALMTSAIVGYATTGLLMRVVERVPFWIVCFGLGGLTIVGGRGMSVLTV